MATVSQTVRYRLADGSYSSNRSDAVIIPSADIAQMASDTSNIVPPGVIVGVAERETNRDSDGGVENEVDQDIDENGNVADSTYGLLMLGHSNTSRFTRLLFPGVVFDDTGFLDAKTSIAVGCAQFEDYANKLASAAGYNSVSDCPNDLWAFVCFAHNAGMGVELGADGKQRALAAAQLYGLDWAKLKASPPFQLDTYISTKLAPYGDHVLQRIGDYPLEVGSADASQSTADYATTPTYRTRKLIAAAFIAVVALIAWEILK